MAIIITSDLQDWEVKSCNQRRFGDLSGKGYNSNGGSDTIS